MTAPAETSGTSSDTTTDATQAAAQAAATAAAETAVQTAMPEWDGKIESLPPAVQKIINDARADAGKARTSAKEQAAAEARDEVTQKIGRALGLINDGGGAPKADELAEQIAVEQRKTRATETQLAVFKAAGAAGADANLLLDSNSFLASLTDVDPSDGDAVKAAITKAIGDNPRFKLAQAAGSSSVQHPGGSGEGAVTPEQFAAMNGAQRHDLLNRNPALYRQLTGR